MRRILLLILLAPTLSNAQFLFNNNTEEYLGVRTGIANWQSNFKSATTGFGPDEDLLYRRENRHWAMELSFNYSNLQQPINYNRTDISGNTSTYDRFIFNSYALIINLQRVITYSNTIKSYAGIYINPVYYSYYM